MPLPEKAVAPSPGAQAEAKPAESKVGEETSAGESESASKSSETAPEEKGPIAKEEAGYYIVKKGENLSDIAGRKDVYSDPLKWPILLRHNLDRLGDIAESADFPERAISEGLKIKVLTPEEVRVNRAERPDNYWVINILSAPTREKIVPQAIRLIQNGYPVYITRIKVKGKIWMRLRLGFFKDKTEADAHGKKIMTNFNIVDFWSTKVMDELEEFGGY